MQQSITARGGHLSCRPVGRYTVWRVCRVPTHPGNPGSPAFFLKIPGPWKISSWMSCIFLVVRIWTASFWNWKTSKLVLQSLNVFRDHVYISSSEFWTANLHILHHGEFSAVHYSLNIVSKCRFSLYLNIRGLRTGPGKFFMGCGKSWKSQMVNGKWLLIL